METTAPVGKVQLTRAAADILDSHFLLKERGVINVKACRARVCVCVCMCVCVFIFFHKHVYNE